MRDNHSSASIHRRSSVRAASLLLTAGLAATLLITACSSSSSSSGIGVSFTRTWSGVMRSNATNQTFPLRVQLVQAAPEVANGLSTSGITGTAIVGQNSGDCIRGGSVTGSTTGSSIVMDFGGNTYSGSVRNNGRLEGLWSTNASTSSSSSSSSGSTSSSSSSTSSSSSSSTSSSSSSSSTSSSSSSSSSSDESASFAACASFDSGDFSIQ